MVARWCWASCGGSAAALWWLWRWELRGGGGFEGSGVLGGGSGGGLVAVASVVPVGGLRLNYNSDNNKASSSRFAAPINP